MHRALSSQIAFSDRNYTDAVEFAQQAIAIDPDFWVGYVQLAQVQVQLGHTDLALEALAAAARLGGANSKTMSLRGYMFAKSGKTEGAHEMLRALEAASRKRYVPPYAVALIYAGLGRLDATFYWLERAYDAHDVHVVFLPVDPKWDAFRADPRFVDLLNRCRLPNRS